MFEILVVVGVLAIVGGVWGYSAHANRRDELAQHLRSIDSFQAAYIHIDPMAMKAIAIDAAGSCVCVAVTTGKEISHRLIPASKIIATELREDGESILVTNRGSQAAGALVGGVLFGGVGAAVGALSGKTTQKSNVRSLMVQVTVNDLATPLYEFEFLSHSVRKGDLQYKNAIQQAREWHARLTAVIRNQDAKEEPVLAEP